MTIFFFGISTSRLSPQHGRNSTLVCIQQTNEIVRVQAIIQVTLSTPSDCVDYTQLQFTVTTAPDTDSLTNYTKLNIQVQLHNQFSSSQVPEFLENHPPLSPK